MKKTAHKTRRQQLKEKAATAKNRVDAANASSNPLNESFVSCKASDGCRINLRCSKVGDLESETLLWIFDLMERNMKTMYEQTRWGWNPQEKQKELSEPAAWYLIATDSEDKYIGFSHFRFDVDYGVEVLYCYELQIEPTARRKGLGRFMMSALESMALENLMQKVVLTVFKRNFTAVPFFHTLGNSYRLSERLGERLPANTPIYRQYTMYTCINCGVEVEELYRRYSPSVLKVLKCNKCGSLADKYIEYDPVIVLVDLVLLEKPAYRHLLYNSGFQSYSKLMIVLLLSESFRIWSTHSPESGRESVTRHDDLKNDIFDGERSFYILLAHTALSLGAFVCAVIVGTELRWVFLRRRPPKYNTTDLVRALTVGGCAKLLGLLGLVWQHVAHDPHYALIHGYTMLCLLTAYSVVCESGRGGSLIGLAGGLLAHDYVSNSISWLPQAAPNITLM